MLIVNMARIQEPASGKLIISTISSSIDALSDVLKALERKFGRIEFETMEIKTSLAGQYREEMGENLYRRFFSFARDISRSNLAEIKTTCSRIEPLFADCIGDYIFRTVNIDPGILCSENLVMTSNREYNNRIYLKDGVFSEIVLIFSGGQFMQLPWTNEDFCDPEAIDLFERVRSSILFENQDKQAFA